MARMGQGYFLRFMMLQLLVHVLTKVVLGLSDANDSSESPKVIILMLGDDYGYNNVGFAHGPAGNDFGHGNPEMRTPNLDQLVKEGIVLDRHYVFK